MLMPAILRRFYVLFEMVFLSSWTFKATVITAVISQHS